MFLIIGLGNPGEQYKKTRHNMGFMALDQLAGNDQWKQDNDFEARICELAIAGQKAILAKPQTFMNESGRAARKICDFYKIPLDNVMVIHDEMDIPFGQIKISRSRSSAGHKGIESIISNLNTQDFIRIRIGIGRPENQEAKNFVLDQFSSEELSALLDILSKARDAISDIIQNGADSSIGKYNAN